ncbi:4-hydroxyphenylacetate 3-hydroxylase [Aureimonas fodinaquatilis]|uniref:4-hydroxyphenylacetate 3-hydroxylase n=1 Tax=Aureimonas fodinaquatilis TaxID=2565783 RepID=A0A5B0DU69_9HYPH|nr:4-hydroxyphenylacetate 3-hydroxylase N-terminal domain-containing protein [Aureimonas fodinaquatilis]KAA0969485.1 4-hydroxyphenylacetate 3-hydroxylase [Aureimonas fodinaquatilis]
MTASALAAVSRSGPATAPLRTGADFLADLRNTPRTIIVDGRTVSDPSSDPAFREAARSIARLYDFAAAPENLETMTYPSPVDGLPALRAYQIPETHDDLRAKRIAAEKWAELTFGLMGRSPDHVAGFFCGFAAKSSVFAAGGQQYADNVVRFYEHLRATHAYVAYAIVPPQIDRSKPAHQQADPTLYAGVVKETTEGIYISGAQQLATGAVFADYIHLSSIHPLRPGDENYALSLAVPATAKGVRLYVRKPFNLQATDAGEYPLTTRFDETDSMVVFDNVFVPWEHVFAYKNLEVTFNQWWKTPAHLYGNLQAQARYATKLRFLLGIAKRMNEITGNDATPPVQVMMGELAAYASIVDGMLKSQETMATYDEEGVLWPSKTSLYSVMALQSEINPKMVDIVREMTGAGMLTIPSSSKDFDNPEIAAEIERYYVSGVTNAQDRIALMRLAWDFIGSEFGNRHQQYEKFYGGASFLVKMNVFRSFDFNRSGALVDKALNLPPVE